MISKKYMARVDDYIEWAKCSTPMAKMENSAKAAELPPSIVHGGDIGAVEWLYRFETHGLKNAECSDVSALSILWKGKAMRDWWTKEIGWMNSHAYVIPEEMLCFLMPLCFIELFGYEPSTPRVRYFYDNGYSDVDYSVDMDWAQRGFERVAGGVIFRGVSQ